jgi:hypothetical protein
MKLRIAMISKVKETRFCFFFYFCQTLSCYTDAKEPRSLEWKGRGWRVQQGIEIE